MTRLNMKIKINEIFQGIQGEGLFVGMPMNFIRFTKCNLNCRWCDTDFINGREMTVKEIIEKLNKKWGWVELTGGEPMLEENLLDLIEELHRKRFKVLLETNSTIFDSTVLEDCDFISADIKPPSSGNPVFDKDVIDYCFINQKKSQLKIVIQDYRDVEFFKKIYNSEYGNWILQPEWSSMKKLDYEKILKEIDKGVRIIPQIHKILEVR